MTDKFPALPPRPMRICADTAPVSEDYRISELVYRCAPTDEYMDAQETRIAELEKEREEAKFAPLGDNHHNASKCPHCRPTLEDETNRIAELERGIREALNIMNGESILSPAWCKQVHEFTQRNAERENGQ